MIGIPLKSIVFYDGIEGYIFTNCFFSFLRNAISFVCNNFFRQDSYFAPDCKITMVVNFELFNRVLLICIKNLLAAFSQLRNVFFYCSNYD